MMRALFSGVTGLSSHQTRMDVIGNNISNVNTVGFKKSTTTFQDLYSQTLTPASAPSGNLGGTNAKQVGLGASVASVVIQHTPGAAQYTGSPLDLALEGDGYFCVRTPEGIRYTRAGNFNISSTGSLVDSSGYFVQCFGADYQRGDSATAKSTGLEGRATAHFENFTHVTTQTTGGATTSTIAADTLSGVYTFETVKDAGGGALGSLKVFRNGIDTGQTVTAAQTAGGYTIDLKGIGLGSITFSTVAGSGTAPGTNTVEFAEELAQVADFINIEVSNNDGFVANSNIADLSVDQGMYYNVTVDEQGAVVAQLREDYTPPAGSNIPAMAKGEKMILGYVTVATFSNTSGLEKLGGNLYNASPNSGTPSYSQAGAQGVGTIAPSSLEMSNVDLSEEMVNMIITQRGFQANSRIITTTDTMLEELINLKR